MRLGIGSYTYPWSVGAAGNAAPSRVLTPLGLLERAHALGVGVVQFCDCPALRQATERELAALREQADARQLELEYGTSGIDLAHLRSEIEIAAALRARVLRVVLDANGVELTARAVRGQLASLVPELQRRRVTLAIENHDRWPARALRRLIDELATPQIGICLDTANSFGAGEGPDIVLETLGPCAVGWHVKDFRVRRLPHRFGFTIEGCPAGEGQLEIARWCERLRTFGRDLNAIIELWPPAEATPDMAAAKEERWAAQSVTFLRRFIVD